MFKRSNYSEFDFPILTLACIQLISAFIVLCLAVKLKFLIVKQIDLYHILIPSILFTCLIGLSYYSIFYNVLFISQIVKLFQIPFLYALNGILNRTFSSNQIKIAMVILETHIPVLFYYI